MKRIILVAILSLSLSACSSMGFGGQDESGTVDPELADGRDFSDQNLNLREEERWGGGNIPVAGQGGLFDDVFFEYDSFIVGTDYRERLRKDAQILLDDDSLRVEVEGHCDKRGTSEYNLALGESRARAVATLLVNFGVDANQISTISYGEEIPLDPDESEDSYAKNRRVHFAIYRNDTPR